MRIILGKRIAPEDEEKIRKWAGIRELPLLIVSELDLLPNGKPPRFPNRRQ